jgi:hypothetical protein
MKKRQKIRKGIILCSFFLFPATFYYLSPGLIIRASSIGVVNGSFVIFLLMFISANWGKYNKANSTDATSRAAD